MDVFRTSCQVCTMRHKTIHEAVSRKDAAAVRTFLEQGANVNEKCVKGRTPLHHCTDLDEDNLEILKLLLDAGADVNWMDRCGLEAFMWAIIRSNFKSAEILIVAGANVNNRSIETDLTALSVATYRNNVKLMEMLISRGALLNTRDVYGHAPLHKAVISSKNQSHSKAVEILLRNGANFNAKDNFGQTALHLLMRRSDFEVEIIRLLFSYGAAVTIPDMGGLTPLELAVNSKFCTFNLGILKLLTNCGTNFDVRISNGSTLLHYACQVRGNFETVKFLLNQGVDIDALDTLGRSPIMCAADLEIFELLLNSGADVSLIDVNGKCLLNYDGIPENCIREILMVMVAKLLVTGATIPPIIVTVVLNEKKYDDFCQMCRDELELAKRTRIKHYGITYFDFLVISKKELRALAGNQLFISEILMGSSKRKVLFPIYGVKMRDNMIGGIKERDLFYKSLGVLYLYMPFFNLDVIESIIEYLTTDDLLRFTEDVPINILTEMRSYMESIKLKQNQAKKNSF